MNGHLARWMQDATGDILAKYAAGEFKAEDLDESTAGDLQAARELAELQNAASNALILIEYLVKHAGNVRIPGQICTLGHYAEYHQKALETALLAVED